MRKFFSGNSTWQILAATSVCTLMAAMAAAETPLEGFSTRWVNFDTAETLSEKQFSFTVGSHQTVGGTTGTGNQLYYTALEYGVTDDLQIAFAAQDFQDPVGPILGTNEATNFRSFGVNLKYRFVNTDQFQASALVSVEDFAFRTDVFDSYQNNPTHTIGSFHVPLTYTANSNLQFHLTPGVSVFPDSINGFDYYGTVATLGAGVTWRASNRLLTFASLSAPLSGGNTIGTDQSIQKELVYTAGARYNFTPKVALEGYVTNGFGATPATGIVTFIPEGDEALFGVRLVYTPGQKLPYTYRPTPLAPVTKRAERMDQDGFTIGSARVMTPGSVRLGASGGSDGNAAVMAAIALEQDFQLEGYIEDYSDDGSLTAADDPTPDSFRWMVGGRIRVMDQDNGNPFSWSLRAMGGRDFDNQNVGVLYIATPASYDVNNRLTFHVEPKFFAFGDHRVGGLGLGVNYEIFEGLQLIGEVTPVSDGRTATWAAGARYDLPNGMWSLDASATNAIGRYGHGTMVAQDETRFAIGLSTQFNVSSLLR